jgi:Fic family protein
MSQKSTFGDTSSTRAWNPVRPHNALPPLPPAVELETKAVLKRCVGARAALAELKQCAELIPNAEMLINTLPVLEARASSEIENVVTTADELFRHLAAEKGADPATKEALRYREALMLGLTSLNRRTIGLRLAEEICSLIKGKDMSLRRGPGTAVAGAVTGRVIYTPPEGEDRLRRLLANWESFVHEAHDLDPLVRMAVGHYQFEAIHPFTDGNGRTGRVLNSLLLVEMGLLPSPILYLSRFIIAHKEDYYRCLLAVTSDAAWETWLHFMLDAVEETSVWTTAKIGAVRGLARHTTGWVREKLPRIYSRELVDVLFEQPYCRIANVVDAGIVERQAASRHLKALAGIGILREETLGREKLFVHDKLLALLTSEEHTWTRYG